MTQAYTRIRILGDESVNPALQSKLDRGKIGSITDYAEKNVLTSHIRELWSSRKA